MASASELMHRNTPPACHDAGMKKPQPSYLLALVAPWLLPMGAQAMPFVQLNESVIRHIPAKDVPDFKAFIGNVLHTGAPDTPHSWSSQQRGNQTPVQVAVTPGQAVTTQAAGTCRLLSAHVTQRSRQETWKVWFCQQANGSWKISSVQ